MTLRLAFTPHGSFDKNGNLATDLNMVVNSLTGGQDRPFIKGRRMAPTEITVEMAGNLSSYPFDQFNSLVAVELSTVPVKKADGSTPDDPQIVPVTVGFLENVQGLDIKAEKDPNGRDGYAALDILVNRSTPIIFFAVFILTLLAVLSLLVVFILLAVAVRKRKLEFWMFAWFGGFLFSFVAIRNALPGAPPIGVSIDFLVFFWALAVVALALTILSGVYLRRPA